MKVLYKLLVEHTNITVAQPIAYTLVLSIPNQEFENRPVRPA